MIPRFLARAARWIEVTFPERQEPGESRFDQHLDMLHARCQ